MNDIIKENKFDCIIPVLNVKNIAESLKYYQHVLGFKKDWDWGEPVSFASVSRDGVSIFLCQDAQGQAGMWMSIFIDNVDDLYEEHKESLKIIDGEAAKLQKEFDEMQNPEKPESKKSK